MILEPKENVQLIKFYFWKKFIYLLDKRYIFTDVIFTKWWLQMLFLYLKKRGHIGL